MTKRLSRLELHEMVWHRPMIYVGADLGITANGLKKVCIKYNIPRPPAGYFQMDLARREELKRNLPDPDNDTEITILGSEQTKLKDDVANVVVASVIDRQFSDEIDDYVRELRSDPRVDERGIWQPAGQGPECLIRCSKERIDFSAERLKLILSTLKANGCEIEFRSREGRRQLRPSKEVHALYGSASEKLYVEESSVREARPFTKTELKEKQQREARGWSYYRLNPWVYTPTGKPLLVFGYAKRRVIGEDVRPLVAAVIDTLKASNDRNIEWERERRHSRAKELWSLRSLRRKVWEERQLDAIEKEAADWERAKRLRRYLSKVLEARAEEDTSVWISMAQRLVSRLDPISSGKAARMARRPDYAEIEAIARKRAYSHY